MKQIFTVILLLLVVNSSFAQQTFGIPPVVKLIVPGDNWQMTSLNKTNMLVSEYLKKIERLDGKIDLSIGCWHSGSLLYGLTEESFEEFLSGGHKNDTIETKIFHGFRVYLETSEGYNQYNFYSGLKTEDGFMVMINFESHGLSLKKARNTFMEILEKTEIISIKEMDDFYGYPLDPKADNTTYIEQRVKSILNFSSSSSLQDVITAYLDSEPLEELVPELFDRFTFSRLYKTWIGINTGTIDINEYFDALIADKISPDINLYHKYANDYSGKFSDAELVILNEQLDPYFDKETYLETGFDVGDHFYACNDKNESAYVWRSYYNEVRTKCVVLCFHKNGDDISSDKNWEISEIDFPSIRIQNWSQGTFYSFPGESNYMNEGCADAISDLFGIKAVNIDDENQVIFGSATNPQTNFYTLTEFNSSQFTVHYTIRNLDYLHGRIYTGWNKNVNVSDSITYDAVFSPQFDRDILALNELDAEELSRKVDSLFVKSYEGNHSSETIEWDLEERPLYYAVNSSIYNLPPKKRAYSSGPQMKDMNNDGTKDAYCFTVSNGAIIDLQLIYNLGDSVQVEENPMAYSQEIINTDLGSLMVRISKQKTNLLPVRINHIVEQEGRP